MDDMENPVTLGMPLPRHLRLHGEREVPPDFAMMRLVLQPSGAVIDVNQPDALVGRHTEADIRLPLPDVSRRHCRLVYGNGWQVVDLNSLNGIQVNGEQVLQAPLDQGDLLRVGGFTFLIDLAARPADDLGSADHVQSIARTLSIQEHRRAS